MDILDSEKRRARNIIWNAARDYSFEPEFKVYDEDGRADLYWNSIIGAARKNYGADTIDALFSALHNTDQEELYEQLVWLGLENAVYQREALHRPALPALRRSYAKRVLSHIGPVPSEELPVLLEEAHFRRVLGETPYLMPRERAMLDALEFSGDLEGAELARELLDFLRTFCHFAPGNHESTKESEKKPPILRKFFRKISGKPSSVHSFWHGYSEHSAIGQGGSDTEPLQRRLSDKSLAQSEVAIRKFIQDYFGQPLYDPGKTAELEHELCVDAHRLCHLYFAKGDDTWDKNIRGFAGARRKEALKLMKLNRAVYDEDAVRHRASIVRLTARIKHAMMAYLQPTVLRSSSGSLDSSRIWRAVYLDDEKVFTKIQQSDPGNLSVDILLDASTSQQGRQATVAAQGYMIAEALTRCQIPVRVSSFCSISGYTVVTRYRDYQETDRNDRIFNYFTAGCNRDGLAIRALKKGLEDSPCEHKLVILLSDVKPDDVIKMYQNGNYVDYAEANGIQNTAIEVRSLLKLDISVICVFTGNDKDVPAAHTIYGRNFARIRSLDQFADTVGALIQNQIRSF